jgi:predicted enzyme related to lactoylglutathione lyase
MGSRFRDCFAILQVSDMRQSLGFYRDLLGFELTYSFPSEQDAQFVSLDVAGGKLGLGGTDQPVATASAAISLSTDDVDAAVADLRAAGVQVLAAVGRARASVADPDGYAETGRYLPSLALAIALARFFDSTVEEVFHADSKQ